MPRNVQTRPVGDFFGPFFTLKFSVPLRLPSSPTSVAAIGPFAVEATKVIADNHFISSKLDSIQLRDYAARLVVEATTESALKFTLTLTPPYDVALEIIDNRLIRMGSVVEVQWGYLDNGGKDISSPVYVFTLNGPPQVIFDKEISITLTGYDPVFSSLVGKERKKIFTRTAYPTDEDLINGILQELKYTADMELVDPETRIALRKYKDAERNPVQEVRDLWLLLQNICTGNNITFYTAEENVVVFHDLSSIATVKEAYRLLYYTKPQSDRDIPMMSFKAEALPAFFASPSKSLLSISYDMDAGKIVRNEIDPESLREKMRVPPTSQMPGGTETSTSGKSIKVADDTTITPSPVYIPRQDFGAVISHPDLLDNKDGQAKSLLLEAIFAANNQATAVCPGHPDVIPPMNVVVEGVGKSFGGTYQVMKVRHEIGSGYEMSLELKRLASPPGLIDGVPVENPVPPSAPNTSGTPAPRHPDKTG